MPAATTSSGPTMPIRTAPFCIAVIACWSAMTPALADPADDYATYCALCHGDDRQGYANDNAPSLSTTTLFAAGLRVPTSAIAYGRPGTPMGPYLDEVGGPMTERQIQRLARWLSTSAGIKPRRRRTADLAPIRGDAVLGAALYQEHCASCHGANGEGGEGTALGNPTMLATAPDLFLKAAITDGRSGTAMAAWRDVLSEPEIDGIVTFLRSRASGWNSADMHFVEPPSLDNIVVNPDGEAPTFELDEGRYVSAAALNAAIEAGNRLILIDTRVPYFWPWHTSRVPSRYRITRAETKSSLPCRRTIRGSWLTASVRARRPIPQSTGCGAWATRIRR